MVRNDKRVDAPLLREYLKRLPRYARYAPHVPGWIPWVVFFALNSAVDHSRFETLMFPVSIAIAWGIPYLVRLPFRPRSAEEKAEQEFLTSVRGLRWMAHDGRLRRRVPPPVLAALERCAGARVTALARLAGTDPVSQAVESESIEGCMRAALVTVLPVVRAEEQRRREWEAICENAAVMGAIVDAIQTLEDRMTRPSGVLTERLAALRELEETQLSSDVTP